MTGDNCRIGDSKVMTNTKGAPLNLLWSHIKKLLVISFQILFATLLSSSRASSGQTNDVQFQQMSILI